jgi:2,4-dienoyl-CoA reductase-like NADH-dependent reductase (Old Yellow Enzyme family)/thioredoxin reductase
VTGNEHYPHLFEPIQIGSVTIPNRLFVTAHGPGYVVPDPTAPGFSLPAPNTADYYVERAKGGAGLIIQGGTVIHPTSEYPTLWQLFSDACVEAWTPIVDAVHAHGTKMFVQLMHAGHHGDHTGVHGGPWSASSVAPVEGMMLGMAYMPLPVPVKEMTVDDIATVIDAFELNARNARLAGYDGVELHGTHSYLVEQFYSPFYNKRADAYGGSLENRLRFMFEVLEALRRGIGDDRAVGVRLACDEMLPGGLDATQMRDIASRVDASGLADFVDLDIGTYHSMDVMIAPYQLGEHWEMDAIAKIRPAIATAAVLGCPGRFHDPAKAEALIASEQLDMVGGTRGFFADPEIGRKAREGRSREIRPCIGLNGCLGGTCVLNPTHGLETTYGVDKLTTAKRGRKVVVVGGGPAGLEAARIAAMRGHDVVLFDAGPELGGALQLMKAVPGRAHVIEAATWWADRLSELGVKVHLATTAAVDDIVAESPDVVIVATGAAFDRTGATAYATDPIPGWDRDFVFTADDVLAGGLAPTGLTLVLEEEAPAALVAETLAARGTAVELVTRHPMVAHALAFSSQQLHEIRRLDALGVVMTPNTWVRDIGDHCVTLFHVVTDRARTVEDVAAVVMVTGRLARNDLALQLAGRVSEVHTIGDALHPRSMGDATREGHHVAWDL